MKNKALMAIFLAILIYMTGCATIAPQRQAMLQKTIPICYGEKECEAKWAAARRWILNNANRKIQIYSNDLIETYNPERCSPGLAARIVKEPTGDGGYFIVATVWCDNIFGCIPKRADALLDFNNYVNSVIVKDDAPYKDLLKKDYYSKPKIGVYLQYINGQVIVKSVFAGSPAEKAGIKPQDVIIQFNNQNITDSEKFIDMVGKVKFGEKIEMKVKRHNDIISLLLEFPSEKEIQEIVKSDTTTIFKTEPEDIENKLESLNRLLNKGLITQEEYNKKKTELLENY